MDFIRNAQGTKKRRLGFWLEGLILALQLIVSLVALAGGLFGNVPGSGVGWSLMAIFLLMSALRGLTVVWSRSASHYVALGLVWLAVLSYQLTRDKMTVFVAVMTSIAIVVTDSIWKRLRWEPDVD